MTKRSLMVLVLALGLVVAGGYALAQGPGWGGHMMGYGWGAGPGWGGPMRGPGYHMGWGYSADPKYYEETYKIQNELYQKNLELDRLLSEETVDEGKVKALQAEINKLQNDLSDQRLAAELEFRKKNPDARSGYYGPGYCWR
ncbi:MAG: hypothetical protein AB1896_12625 [Thermodesulfobacteriota bacterium]